MVSLAYHDAILTIRCESAIEFVEVLAPLGGLFQSTTQEGSYIFRGVSSSEYQLLPTAFRSGKALWMNERVFLAPLPGAFYQCAAELETLSRFFQIAAREGIRLPEDSQEHRSVLERWRRRFRTRSTKLEPFVWPPSELYSLIALAQHYGVPTRALDWTWDTLTAAYFAAATEDRYSKDRDICVWAFDTRIYALEAAGKADPNTPLPLVLASAPGADNDNLRAQRGMVMLYTQSVVDYEAAVDVPPYESFYKDRARTYLFPVFAKIQVPAVHANDVIAIVGMSGVSASKLFPGLWGVARELSELTRFPEMRPQMRQNETTLLVRQQLPAAVAKRGA